MAKTVIESNLETAVKALDASLLSLKEGKFITDIREYNKQDLNKLLTDKQKTWLRKIAETHKYQVAKIDAKIESDNEPTTANLSDEQLLDKTSKNYIPDLKLISMLLEERKNKLSSKNSLHLRIKLMQTTSLEKILEIKTL